MLKDAKNYRNAGTAFSKPGTGLFVDDAHVYAIFAQS
jgi:hypothetical protein